MNTIDYKELCDSSKELINVLNNCENDIKNKIPERIVNYFKNLGEKSTNEFKIDTSKTLSEQKISGGCRYLIAMLYFSYVADETEKDELRKIWIKNEIYG